MKINEWNQSPIYIFFYWKLAHFVRFIKPLLCVLYWNEIKFNDISSRLGIELNYSKAHIYMYVHPKIKDHKSFVSFLFGKRNKYDKKGALEWKWFMIFLALLSVNKSCCWYLLKFRTVYKYMAIYIMEDEEKVFILKRSIKFHRQ